MISDRHTPGPWQFGIRGAGFSTAELARVYEIPAISGDDGLRQNWACISADKPCTELSPNERAANGRLMAAAPDLLQAGKHLAVKLAEAYRIAKCDPAKCQAIVDFMDIVAKAEDR